MLGGAQCAANWCSVAVALEIGKSKIFAAKSISIPSIGCANYCVSLGVR